MFNWIYWFSKVNKQINDLFNTKAEIRDVNELNNRLRKDHQASIDRLTNMITELRNDHERLSNLVTGLSHDNERLFQALATNIDEHDGLFEELKEQQHGLLCSLGLLSQDVTKLMNAESTREEVLVSEAEIGKNSGEPWANITFYEYDPSKGSKFEGDWNQEFIDNLKASGFTGRTDEEIFQKYMARVALHVSSRFEEEQETINRMKGIKSEFE